MRFARRRKSGKMNIYIRVKKYVFISENMKMSINVSLGGADEYFHEIEKYFFKSITITRMIKM